MKKILLLNAPPRAGKDSMAEWFERNHGWYHAKFSKVLKERTHELYGLRNVAHDHYEETKSENNADFYGISPRQAYINTSELLMKPVHGESIWADMMADDLEKEDHEYVVISDLGFQVEWETFIKRFGYKILSLGMIYRSGCNFNKDSRNYINPRGPWEFIDPPDNAYIEHSMGNCFDIENGGSIEDLYSSCSYIYLSIVYGREIPKSSGVKIGQMKNNMVGG